MSHCEENEYISCNIIEHGFDAQISSINLCCRVSKDNITSKLVLFPNYRGERINWENFFQITSRLREIQKRGGIIEQCKGCIYLEKREWDSENYINSINIDNWIKCNANCIYCDRKEHKKEKEYRIYPLIKDLIEKRYLRNNSDITIAGGEPTITSDFDKTLKILIKNNIRPVRVLTNAIRYNRYIELGLKKSIVNILVSVDSGIKETYKKIKLTDKHKNVWKNIAKYVENQKEPTLVKTKYIMIPGINTNKNELNAYMERNVESGIKHTCIDLEISAYVRMSKNKEF